ncbi:MAG: hypothetical protein HY276_04645, partial [Ignavibacteriales bacterium]|nr:hypothetical protein [Ignavibacteriales bacterium]
PPEKFMPPTATPNKTELPAATIHHIAPTGKSWVDEIDERIRLKAGNVVMHQPDAAIQQKLVVSSQEPVGKTSYGVGITEEQIDKIIREFQK